MTSPSLDYKTVRRARRGFSVEWSSLRKREREIISRFKNRSFIKSQDECHAVGGLWTNHESCVGQIRGETHNTKSAQGETLTLGSVFFF